jgi:anti-anti-sigma regulatory factor
MLRITKVAESPSSITLKLEGRLVSDWVSLVERECLALRQGQRQISLDFSEVTFIDDRGVKMLQRIASADLKVVNCPAFIADLLKIWG